MISRIIIKHGVLLVGDVPPWHEYLSIYHGESGQNPYLSDMSRDIFHIRDNFMKSFMADIEMGQEFIRTFYPEEITKILDFSTLQHSSTSFISDRLKATQADIVFECQTLAEFGGGLLNLCFLIEHKSSPSRHAAVQIGGYIFDAYRKQVKAGKSPLIPVIPLLYYHGGRKWQPALMTELFDVIPPSVEAYIPSFLLLFENIQNYTDEQIWQMGSGLFASALMMQKYSDHPEELVRRFIQIFTILESYSDRNLTGSIVVYYAEMLQSEEENFESLLDTIPEKMKTEFISLADRWRNEGLEKGREEKQDVMIENMIRKGSSIKFISEIADVPEEYILKIQKRIREEG